MCEIFSLFHKSTFIILPASFINGRFRFLSLSFTHTIPHPTRHHQQQQTFINFSSLQMNETYQKPGKWEERILYPTPSRHDSRHFVMSYIINQLEHNSVYEVMVQAKNRYGWNEVRKKEEKFSPLQLTHPEKRESFFTFPCMLVRICGSKRLEGSMGLFSESNLWVVGKFIKCINNSAHFPVIWAC